MGKVKNQSSTLYEIKTFDRDRRLLMHTTHTSYVSRDIEEEVLLKRMNDPEDPAHYIEVKNLVTGEWRCVWGLPKKKHSKEIL